MYECKNDRVYQVRPSATKQLVNPNKYQRELNNEKPPDEIIREVCSPRPAAPPR
jgi:hypothetical protein